MHSSTQIAGPCPQCSADSVVCRFNFFDRGDLQVHSWEHKCVNCGWRQTHAFRSDAPQSDPSNAPTICPWCGRSGGGS